MSERAALLEPRLPALLVVLGLAEAQLVVGPDLLAFLVVAVMGAPLALRRTRPLLVVAIVTAGLVVQLPWAELRIFDQTFTGFLCWLTALYGAGRHRTTSLARLLLVVGACAGAGGVALGLHDSSVTSALLAAGVSAAAAWVGHSVRTGATALVAIEEQTRELATSADDEERVSTLAARAEVAGMVQSSVAHLVREMMAASTSAQRSLGVSVPTASDAVSTIEDRGRAALTAMRRTLTALRAEPPPSATSSPATLDLGRDAAVLGSLRRFHPVVVLALVALTTADAVSLSGSAAPAAVAAFAVAAPTPLLWARDHPLLSAVAGWGAAAALAAVVGVPGSWALAAMAYAFAAAAHSSHRTAAIGVLTGLVGVLVVNQMAGSTDLADHVFPAVLVCLAAAAGRLAARQRGLLTTVAATARELDRARTLRAESAAAEERRRLARELHDVVAHHVMAMVVQAGAARRLIERDPGQAVEALEAIDSEGRQALADLSDLLELMTPHRRPTRAVGLSRLQDLVSRARATGLQVSAQTVGAPSTLPAEQDLAAYRIVQEALTNAIRHSGARHATVRVSYGTDELRLEVRDDGVGELPGTTRSGLGLVGMQERAARVGGTLQATSPPGGGFRVVAVLPVHALAPGRSA